MSNIYFMCDNCGIETNGFTFVNGMKFCAKCYHQIFGKDNQQTEITQLKQQLAEKDKRIAELENENGYILFEDGYDENGKEVHRQVYTTYHQAFNELVFEAKKLRRQLKEKDKEIEKLKQQYTILENENGKLTTDLIMDKYKKAKKEVSFGKQLAVSELEKVRDYAWFNYEKFRNYLNQQIKELKGE